MKTIAPEVINPSGRVSAILAQEFGLIVIKNAPERIEGAEPNNIPAILESAAMEPANTELPGSLVAVSHPDAGAAIGALAFVDLRYGETSQERWIGDGLRRLPAWNQERNDTFDLWNAALDSHNGLDRSHIILSRAAAAVYHHRFTSRFGTAATESDMVGFDTSLWPYRRFCVAMSQRYDHDRYMSLLQTPDKKPMSWRTYHELLPNEW